MILAQLPEVVVEVPVPVLIPVPVLMLVWVLAPQLGAVPQLAVMHPARVISAFVQVESMLVVHADSQLVAELSQGQLR